MPETNVILWTLQNPNGDCLFPQTSLNQVFLSENDPTTRISQNGIIKRAYVPHDVTPIIGRFDNEHIPNPNDYQLNNKYYSIDTNKIHTIKAETDWTNDTSVNLIKMASYAPSSCSKNDKYFNTSVSKIYTAIATDTWSEEGDTPLTTVLYIDLDSNKAYRWLNSEMVVSHRWTDGTFLEEDRIVIDVVTHHAYHYHGGILHDISGSSSGEFDFDPD